MLQRLGKLFRQLLAAFLLLSSFVLAGEYWLRGHQGRERIITSQAAMPCQELLQ